VLTIIFKKNYIAIQGIVPADPLPGLCPWTPGPGNPTRTS